jgi:hypothetical protein
LATHLDVDSQKEETMTATGKECTAYFRGRDHLGTCDDECQWYPGDDTCPFSKDLDTPNLDDTVKEKE